LAQKDIPVIMIATPSSPSCGAFRAITIPPLSRSTTTKSICHYNAGILDISDHATVDTSTMNSTPCSQKKKAMAVIDMIMMSDCHRSEPLLDFDLTLLEQIVEAGDAVQQSVKMVRFAEYDEIHLVTCLNDMSPEDIADMYMSHDEQVASKQRAFDELLLISCKSQHEDINSLLRQDSICVRGLENHMMENAHRFRERVNKLYDIVYDCQTFEEENDILVSEEFLAQQLMQVSERCAVEALKRAAWDEEEAKKIQS
jgi:hypothetical protein